MFREKAVIITGASSGLGATLALELARDGAHLALFSPQEKEQREVVGLCEEVGGKAMAVIGDVTAPQDCKRLVDETLACYWRVNYLIANAGISMWARFDEIEDLEVFRRLVEINYLGALNCIYHALPHLKESRGMIAAITSIQSKIGVPQHTGYVASKHALQGFCEALRMELEDSGVDILTVLPHWLRGTDLRKNALGKSGEALGSAAKKHSKESVSLEDASRAIMKALHNRESQLIIPWKLKLLLLLNLLRPRWAESLIKGAMGKQKER